MNIKWKTDRSKVVNGETYLITIKRDGDVYTFWEDEFYDGKFGCEDDGGEVLAFTVLPGLSSISRAEIHHEKPKVGDYYIVVYEENGKKNTNIDFFDGNWELFDDFGSHVVGWVDYPEPYNREKAEEKKLRKREAKRKAVQKAHEEDEYRENIIIPEIKKRTLNIISEMGQFIPGEVTKMVMLSAGEWIMNPSDDNIKEVIQMELDCWNEQFENPYGKED